MSFKEFIETDEHYLLSFEPALSQDQLSNLPHPYWGRTRLLAMGPCGDVSVAGWPNAAVVLTDLQSEPVIALEKHALRLTALSKLAPEKIGEVLNSRINLEYSELMTYIGKISKLDWQKGAVAAS